MIFGLKKIILIKILNEAIEELKESEFKDLYAEENSKPKDFVREVQIRPILKFYSLIIMRIALPKD